jgi:hypothetical protein
LRDIPFLKTKYRIVRKPIRKGQFLIVIIKGEMKVNWLLVPAILLTIVCFIPKVYWALWFGVGGPFYLRMFQFAETQMLLTCFSGILLVRSVNKNNK